MDGVEREFGNIYEILLKCFLKITLQKWNKTVLHHQTRQKRERVSRRVREREREKRKRERGKRERERER